MKTMITNKATLAVMMFMLTPACNAADEQAPSGVENRGFSEHLGLADLPRITRRGIEYPYMRYSESTGQADSHGQIFYLYPTARLRNELVALEYEPGARVNGLVVEEILGSVGLIVNEGRQIRVEFLPTTLPLGVTAGQQWHMRYLNREYVCRSRAVPGPGVIAGQIAVSCASAPHRLNFIFERERGVTEYQDFCGHSICTFRLTDPLGLLSRATLEFMGLPRI